MFLVTKIRARLAICTSERHMLKGSYDVAKNNIIWCNAMCLCGLRLKKHIIFHILFIIVSSL